MDFDLTADQKRWHDTAAAFAREHLSDPAFRDRDEARQFWREGWVRCGEAGLHGLAVPTDLGGQGLGLPETIAAMEGLGYACEDGGLLMALNACLWTVTLPILSFGTEAQKRRFLPPLCRGELIGANLASEPEAGSDIFSMQLTAERRGNRWILNGRKTWVTSGPIADLFVCYASTDPSKGILGVTGFVIERGTPGLRVVREIPKMGLRTVPMGELALEGCEVPAENVLGREGRGAEVFNASMEWERGAILAAALGTMRRQLERCIEFARRRKQFGKPIGKFQAVANRIVHMKVRLETCRPLVYKIGWLKAQGRDATMEAAMAKLYVSDCFVANSLDAVQLFGVRGYVTENGVEQLLRDAVGSTIFSGTNDIQRNIIAHHLRV